MLTEAAELAEIAPPLIGANKLVELWSGDKIAVQTVLDYFGGTKVVQVQRDGYSEPQQVARARQDVVAKAVAAAVEGALVWLRSGPASILGEPIPAGVLTPAARLPVLPPVISAAEILPENLQGAWLGEETTALAITSGLSRKLGKTLPCKTIRDVIGGALHARLIELCDGSAAWPCEYHAAQTIRVRVAMGGPAESQQPTGGRQKPNVLTAAIDLEPSEIMNLADPMPRLLEIKAKSKNSRYGFACGSTSGTARSLPRVTRQLRSMRFSQR